MYSGKPLKLECVLVYMWEKGNMLSNLTFYNTVCFSQWTVPAFTQGPPINMCIRPNRLIYLKGFDPDFTPLRSVFSFCTWPLQLTTNIL